MSRPPRDRYEHVVPAIRLALERAAAAAPLPRSSHQTLEAIIAIVSSYSRFEDRVSVAQLAGFSRLHQKTVEKALHQLRDLGIVVYEGGRGRGNVSRVGLPANPEKGAASGSVIVAEKGVESNGKRSRFDAKRESLRLPSREDSREDSRGNGGAARGAPPLLDEECMQCGQRRPCIDDGERVLCVECAGAPSC